MAQKLDELIVELKGDNKDLIATLKQSQSQTADAMKGITKSISEMADQSIKNTKSFAGSWQTAMGVVAGELVLKGLEKVAEGFEYLGEKLQEGIKLAAAEQLAFTRLDNSLKMTGRFTAETSLDLKEFAEAKEKNLGIDTALTASNLAVLSTLTKLDKEGLKKAQQAAIDLSAALGKDLNESTMIIARAINGSVTGLQRMGIHIEATANKSQNLDNILRALSSTQGAAEAQTHTYSGAVNLLDAAQDNLLRSLGAIVTTNPVVVDGLSKITKAMNEQADSLKENKGWWQGLLNDVYDTGLGLAVGSVYDLSHALDIIKLSSAAVTVPLYAMGETALEVGKDFNAAMYGADRSSASFEYLNHHLKDLKDTGNADTTTLQGMINALQGLRESADAARNPLKDLFNTQGSLFGGVLDKISGTPLSIQAHIETQNKPGGENDPKAAQEKLDAHKKFLEEMLGLDVQDDALRLTLLKQKSADQLKEYETLRRKDFISASELAKSKTLLDKKLAQDTFKIENDAQTRRLQMRKAEVDVWVAGANLLAEVAGEGSKVAFLAVKAAAIAQSIIATELAATMALATPPAPNVAASGYARAQGRIGTAIIVATALKGLDGGVDRVPGVGFQDNFPAMLRPGERVLRTESNRRLDAYLDMAMSGDRFGDSGGRIHVELALKDELGHFIEAKILEMERTGTSQRRRA